MQWVLLDRRLVDDCQLPPVCVRTGRPADVLVPLVEREVPGWTWWLLPFGVLPFLVASWLAGEQVVARLPLVEEVVAEQHRLGRLVARAALVGAGTGAALFLAGAMRAAVAVLVVAGLGVLGLVAWRRNRVPRFRRRPGDRLRLRGVHPDFVAALAADGRTVEVGSGAR